MFLVDLVKGAGRPLFGDGLVTGHHHFVQRKFVGLHRGLDPAASRNGHADGIHAEKTDFEDRARRILHCDLVLAVGVGDRVRVVRTVHHGCAGDGKPVAVQDAALDDLAVLRPLCHSGDSGKQQERERQQHDRSKRSCQRDGNMVHHRDS